ncbi:MAG: PhnD/SsuA/transferrin family substrate-binding protein [Nitrosopumilus sp.]|nr:PhnD/SsuA/transferrin family substrate-binding protein [Nitrosopumilus sp.]MDA7957545.1 PhnD/SsuA/transferrin family substrate-binding protein [Nitrosopumilus sp.]
MRQMPVVAAIIIAGALVGGGIAISATVDPDGTDMQISEANTDAGIERLDIGLIPVEKGKEPEAKSRALEQFLSSELGIPVSVTYATAYEPIIESLRFGHLDAAMMDTGPAWIAHRQAGAEVLMAELVNGKTSYQATVWAPSADNSIQSLEDTVGKRVAFTSITGSSGFVRPVGTLVSGGSITVAGDDIVALERALGESFESHTFAGGYKAALDLLIEGRVDAAFGSDIAAQKYLEPGDQTKIRPAASIGRVPSHVLVASADLGGPAREALVEAMIKLNYDEHNQILVDMYGAEAMVPTSTDLHFGDFGTVLDGLAGLEQRILAKYDKSAPAGT